jgi:hypothetical protein
VSVSVCVCVSVCVSESVMSLYTLVVFKQVMSLLKMRLNEG